MKKTLVFAGFPAALIAAFFLVFGLSRVALAHTATITWPEPAFYTNSNEDTGDDWHSTVGIGLTGLTYHSLLVEGETGTIYIPRSPGHHTEHDVEKNLSLASAVIATYSSFAITNPPPGDQNIICAQMRIAGQVVRQYIWVYTHTNAVSGVDRGTLLIWNTNTLPGESPWVSIFQGQNSNSLLKVPRDFDQSLEIIMEQVGCGSTPPPALPAG